MDPGTISRSVVGAAPSCAPHLSQRTAYARQLRVNDLLPDLRDQVTGVAHGDVTYVRFASGRIQTFRPWEQMQVVRDGRRAARAWVLEMLAVTEFSEAMAQTLPWFLADALEQLVDWGRVTRTSRGTFARAA